MAIFPFAPDQTIAQMWSNGARGGDVIGIADSTNLLSCHLALTRSILIKVSLVRLSG